MNIFSGDEFKKKQIRGTKIHENCCLRPNSQSKLSALDDVVMFKNIRKITNDKLYLFFVLF